MTDIYAVILAAGQGKRMNATLPKVLLPLNGTPMIEHVISVARKLNPQKIILVVGYMGDKVIEATRDMNVQYVWQKKQHGTGHAVLQTAPILKHVEGNTLVLYGDTPLITIETLNNLYAFHKNENAAATILTAIVDNPNGYGRIIRTSGGNLAKMVEDKDASSSEKKVREINSGIYIFRNELLFDGLAKINNRNAQKEYFLPDVINIFLKEKRNIAVFSVKTPNEVLGANTEEQLVALAQYARC